MPVATPAPVSGAPPHPARRRDRRSPLTGALLAATLLVGLLAVGPPPPVVHAQAPIDVARYGPPDWVRPGIRISSYVAAAAVNQSGYQIIEDPEGPWEDPVTGRKYRKTDETGEGVGGASGDGISEIDVIAVEGNDVVLSFTMYTIDRGRGLLSVLPIAGWRQAGGAVDGLWVHPGFLATLRTGDIGGLLVLRGPYALNGTTYDAVSVINPTQGAYASYTYDTVSGLLLASTTRTSGTVSPVRVPGQDPPSAADQLGISRFVSVRQLDVPGIGARPPSWVAPGRTLDYAGTSTATNPLAPDNGTFTWPMRGRTTLGDVGTTWAGYQMHTVTDINGVQSPGLREGVTSGTGLFWWSPDALARMTPGQMLDTDPLTGMQVAVGAAGQGPGGATLDIQSGLPGTAGIITYDAATGVMVRFRTQTATDGTTTDLALQAMP